MSDRSALVRVDTQGEYFFHMHGLRSEEDFANQAFICSDKFFFDVLDYGGDDSSYVLYLDPNSTSDFFLPWTSLGNWARPETNTNVTNIDGADFEKL